LGGAGPIGYGERRERRIKNWKRKRKGKLRGRTGGDMESRLCILKIPVVAEANNESARFPRNY